MKISLRRILWLALLAPDATAQPSDSFAFDGLTRHYLANSSPTDGSFPEVVSAAPLDYDGDGDPDLVRAVYGGIEIVENRGGAYLLRGSITLPGWGSALAVASGDLDGDGKGDFAAAGYVTGNPPTGVLITFLGDGAGSFAPQPQVSIPGYLPALTTADCDRDGKTDLVVSDRQATEVLILFANGGSHRFDLGFAPSATVAADLDGDQFPDLVTLHFGPNGDVIQVRLNDGHGRFPTGTDRDALADYFDLLAADADGDGDLDVITTETVTETFGVVFLPNDGHGALGAPTSSTLLDWWGYAEDIAGADRDGDGHLDLVIATGSRLLTARGLGQGKFALVSSVAAGLTTLAIADVDGDGDADVSSGGAQTIDWRRDLSLGGIAVPNRDAVYLEPADFDRDGLTDVVGVDAVREVVQWFRSDGEGGFALGGEFPVPDDAYTPVVGAVDQDGWPDLIMLRYGLVATMHNDQHGGIDLLRSTVILNGVGYARVAGDVNGDGLTDLILSDKYTTNGSILLANGDGTFAEHLVTFPIVPGHLLLADLDRDARLDLIYVPRGGSALVTIHRGRGDGSFTGGQALTAPVTLQPYAAAADLDGDRDIDLVFATGHGIAIVRNGGAAGFSFEVNDADAELEDLEIGDFDRDGAPDVLALSEYGYAAYLFRNVAGDLVLTTPAYELSRITDRASLAVADVNGDGAPDLIADFPYDGPGSIFLNHTNLRARGVAGWGRELALELRAPGHAGETYVLLVSSRGSSPGVFLGLEHLALNPDLPLWSVILSGVGAGTFADFIGALDQDGQAAATLRLPHGSGALDLDLGFLTLGSGNRVTWTSNALGISIE